MSTLWQRDVVIRFLREFCCGCSFPVLFTLRSVIQRPI